MVNDIDVQSAFIRTLLTSAREDVFVETADLADRLDVYRRNFMQGNCNALKKTFAMTAVYLGEDVFTSAAVRYVCTHRPLASELFATFGEHFPDMLEDPFAKELARLEWVLQTVAMAKEDVSDWDQMLEGSDTWQLRSDVRLFTSPYNVAESYAALKAIGLVNVKVNTTSYYVVYSQEAVPIIFPLNPNEYAFLSLLQSPKCIDEIFDTLTISQEICINLISRLCNRNFLKKA